MMVRAFTISVFIFLSAIMFIAFFEPLYWSFQKTENEKVLLHNVLEYFSRDAQLSEQFNGKERAHLGDVKSVIWTIAYLWIITGMAGLAILSLTQNRRRILKPTGIWLISFSAIGAIFGLFFNRFFTGIHTLLFRPMSWVFPSGSLILGVFPIGFFQTAYFLIISLLLIIGAGLIVVHKRI